MTTLVNKQHERVLSVVKTFRGLYPETFLTHLNPEGEIFFTFTINHELEREETKLLADIGLRISKQDYKQGTYNNPFKYDIELVSIAS